MMRHVAAVAVLALLSLGCGHDTPPIAFPRADAGPGLVDSGTAPPMEATLTATAGPGPARFTLAWEVTGCDALRAVQVAQRGEVVLATTDASGTRSMDTAALPGAGALTHGGPLQLEAVCMDGRGLEVVSAALPAQPRADVTAALPVPGRWFALAVEDGATRTARGCVEAVVGPVLASVTGDDFGTAQTRQAPAHCTEAAQHVGGWYVASAEAQRPEGGTWCGAVAPGGGVWTANSATGRGCPVGVALPMPDGGLALVTGDGAAVGLDAAGGERYRVPVGRLMGRPVLLASGMLGALREVTAGAQSTPLEVASVDPATGAVVGAARVTGSMPRLVRLQAAYAVRPDGTVAMASSRMGADGGMDVVLLECAAGACVERSRLTSANSHATDAQPFGDAVAVNLGLSWLAVYPPGLPAVTHTARMPAAGPWVSGSVGLAYDGPTGAADALVALGTGAGWRLPLPAGVAGAWTTDGRVWAASADWLLRVAPR